MNDRSLRNIVNGLGGTAHGVPRETGYDIVAASEIMAILCLSTSLNDMKDRFSQHHRRLYARQQADPRGRLNAQGPMAVLMKEAIKPNLVQTLENTPTFVHGGPFANIAHGCNSALATQTALKLADYVVTEAGFGADLGAEKFVDIKCRKTGCARRLAVLVGTARALKYSGGAEIEDLNIEDTKSLMQGHGEHGSPRQQHPRPLWVAGGRCAEPLRQRHRQELELISSTSASKTCRRSSASTLRRARRAPWISRERFDGQLIEHEARTLKFVYDDEDPLWKKIGKVAKSIYDASEVVADTAVRKKIEKYQEDGFGHLPICIAKTQYSFSTDPQLRGAPSGHVFNVRDVYLSAGAEFMVVLSGDIMTMPGLPKKPAADGIDIDDTARSSAFRRRFFGSTGGCCSCAARGCRAGRRRCRKCGRRAARRDPGCGVRAHVQGDDRGGPAAVLQIVRRDRRRHVGAEGRPSTRSVPMARATDAFPSGHAATAFQGAAFIHRRYGIRRAWPAYVLATFTAWTRVDADEHDTADVLAGAAARHRELVHSREAAQRERHRALRAATASGLQIAGRF